MKNFYSLLYIRPNVLHDELILIGMIAGVSNQPHFYISEDRLKLVRKILRPNQFNSLKGSLNAILAEIEDLSRMPESLPLFDHPYSFSVIKKTALYKKNLLVYSDPSEIVEPKLVKFEKLVHHIFNEQYKPFASEKKPKTFRSKWLQKQKEIEHNLVRKRTLSPSQIQTIFFPHQVDLLGCFDQSFVSFHCLDLEASPRTIEKNVFEYSRLVRGLEDLAKRRGYKEGHHFLIYESPKKKLAKELLSNLESDPNKTFTFLKIHEFEKIVRDLGLDRSNTMDEILD